MSDAEFSRPKAITVIVQRQLESLTAGNGAYLEMFLRAARKTNAQIRILFAPWRSFGNRPWSKIHPRFSELSDEIMWPDSIKFGSYYWSHSPRVWFRFMRRVVVELGRRFGLAFRVKSYLASPLESQERSVVVKYLQNHPSDVVVAEYSALAPILKSLPSSTTKAALMHDLMASRCAEFRAMGHEPDFEEMSLEEEAALVEAAELMIYASANEMADFASYTPQAKAIWLKPEPMRYTVKEEIGPVRLVYMGTLHAGNVDALSHFLDDIWPQVREKLPEIELWIVGSVGQSLSEAHSHLPGVKKLGRVEELSDVSGALSIGIAPTRLASGVSIKVADYLMLGMTSVAYRKALQGFGDLLDEWVETAGDESAFAEAIVSLVGNETKRREQARIAPDALAHLLSNDSVTQCLNDYLNSGTDYAENNKDDVSTAKGGS